MSGGTFDEFERRFDLSPEDEERLDRIADETLGRGAHGAGHPSSEPPSKASPSRQPSKGNGSDGSPYLLGGQEGSLRSLLLGASLVDVQAHGLAFPDQFQDFAEAVAAAAGLTAPLGDKFADVLRRTRPPFDLSDRDAKFWHEPGRGRWVFNPSERDSNGRLTYALAEVYAAAISGWLRPELGRSEMAYWKLRALVDLGFVKVPLLPPIPGRLNSPEAEEMAESIRLLLSIRRELGYDRAPLTRPFLIFWGGLTRMYEPHDFTKGHNRVRAMIETLARREILVRVETVPGQHPMHIWSPGPGWKGAA